jgi:hypothetical protein
MNERIQELAEQAGLIPGIMGLNRFTYFDTEKFAELIVRECCDVLFDNEMGGYQVNYVLKEHFGVDR